MVPDVVARQMAVWHEISRKGHDLHVIGNIAESSPWLENETLEWTELQIIKPRRVKEPQTWWWLPGLDKTLEELHPDIVHVWGEAWSLSVLQSRKASSPVVAHGCDNLFTFGGTIERMARLGFARANLRRLAGYASWNRAGADLARRFGLPEDRPTLVACPALWDPAPFKAAAAQRHTHRQRFGFGDEVVVGFVGWLGPEKGVSWLIEAFGKIGVRAQLSIFGAGPELANLRRLAESLNVNAQFRGAVPLRDIPTVMAALDLLVVPSLSMPAWQEQWGRVVGEAMLAGTPVIASSSGSLPEVVGQGGIVVQEGDVDALGSAIQRLVTDEVSRRAAAACAAAWANDRFDPGKEADRIISFWHQILQSG